MDLTSKEEVCKMAKKDYVTPELRVIKIEQSAALLQDSGIDFDVTEDEPTSADSGS